MLDFALYFTVFVEILVFEGVNRTTLRTQKKREALHYRSLHVLRHLRKALQVETSNAEAPRRYVHHTITKPIQTNGPSIHQ